MDTSYRTSAMGFHWPDSIEEVPLLTQLDGNTAHLKDGSSRVIDTMILCTGYLHHFPFMADQLRLKTHNRLYPGGLCKGVVWTDKPKLMYLGMQDQFYTFSMFDAQAWYARDVIMGRIDVPSKAEMEADIEQWKRREESLQTPFEQIDFQTDYCKDLCAAMDYPPLDWDMAADLFKAWEHDKAHSIVGYRNKAFASPVTGTKASVHHTPWLEAMDDSMAAFLASQ